MTRSLRVRLRTVLLGSLIAVVGCGGGGPPASPFEAPESPGDARIRAELRRRIAAEPSLTRAQIRVEVRAGTVLLHGVVNGMGEWECAMTNAELTDGVRTVVDYLVLSDGPQQVRCLAPRLPALVG